MIMTSRVSRVFLYNLGHIGFRKKYYCVHIGGEVESKNP